MAPGGYFGRALVVDAGTGVSEELTLPDELLRTIRPWRDSAGRRAPPPS